MRRVIATEQNVQTFKDIDDDQADSMMLPKLTYKLHAESLEVHVI